MPTELPQSENDPESSHGSSPSPSGAPRPTPASHDSGAFRIATIAGIPIRVHFTFLLLLAWLFGANAVRGQPWMQLAFILAIFGCVVLHELGHALVARRYGIRTRNIVLYPIGGVASLETSPRPRQELWISLAGPAVNLLIAGILFAVLSLTGPPIGRSALSARQPDFVTALLWANLLLAAFNMLPAFPMDGGRVLRALIARVTDETTATTLAARIGQSIALLGGVYAFLHANLPLVIVAVFVYLGAGQEAAAFQTRSLITGHRVREAMLREFQTLSGGATLRQAADALIASSQQDFPIVHGAEVIGLLSRSALLRGIASEGWEGYVAGVMEREYGFAHPDEDLETVLARGGLSGAILVMEGDPHNAPTLVGMLTQENLMEFLTLTQLRMRLHPNG